MRDEHQAVAPRRVESPSHAPVDLRRILATEPEERPVEARSPRLANVIVVHRSEPARKVGCCHRTVIAGEASCPFESSHQAHCFAVCRVAGRRSRALSVPLTRGPGSGSAAASAAQSAWTSTYRNVGVAPATRGRDEAYATGPRPIRVAGDEVAWLKQHLVILREVQGGRVSPRPTGNVHEFGPGLAHDVLVTGSPVAVGSWGASVDSMVRFHAVHHAVLESAPRSGGASVPDPYRCRERVQEYATPAGSRTMWRRLISMPQRRESSWASDGCFDESTTVRRLIGGAT